MCNMPTTLLSEKVIQLLYHIFSVLELIFFFFHIYLYILFLSIADGFRMREGCEYQGNRFDTK